MTDEDTEIEESPSDELEEDVDLDEDLDEIVGLEDDELDDEFVAGDDDEVDADAAGTDEDDEDEEGSRPGARRTGDEEDDDDEADPDDVEADLDEILRDRLSASDDDDEDDPEDGVKPADVAKQRVDEFVCGTCFLVVNRAQLGVPCPMGDGVEPHSQL